MMTELRARRNRQCAIQWRDDPQKPPAPKSRGSTGADLSGKRIKPRTSRARACALAGTGHDSDALQA